MKTYTFHHNPGHGWLELPLQDLRDLDIKVSKYSYYDDDNAYLEEDCDAPRAVGAMESKGISFQIVDKIHHDRCFIRDLSRSRPRRV